MCAAFLHQLVVLRVTSLIKQCYEAYHCKYEADDKAEAKKIKY